MNENDPFSLGNNLIYSLNCSSDSGLWVGTSRGLYYHDFKYDDFHPVAIVDDDGNELLDLEILSMLLDGGHLWIGTSKGLYKYDLLREQFLPYLKPGTSKITESVEAIHRLNDEMLLVGGAQGLFYIADESLNRVPNSSSVQYNNSSRVISITSDDQERIWFGTMDLNAGLIVYDPKSGVFKELTKEEGYLPHNKVNQLYHFSTGDIWVGTTWGLAIVDQRTFESEQIMYERAYPGSISHNSIKSIFQGVDGLMWIGTYSGGVNYFDPNSPRIIHVTNIYESERSLNYNIVSAIFEDLDQDLWIGTEYGGLNILDRSTNRFRLIKKDLDGSGLINDNIKSITQDKKGRKFIATQFGLSIINSSDNTIFNIDENPGARGRLNFRIVRDLCLDAAGNVWIGTNKWDGTSKALGPGYLIKYDIERDTIFHYPPTNLNLGVVDGGVHSLVYDSAQDYIWSGGDDGLTVFDIKSGKYVMDQALLSSIATLDGYTINDLHVDKNGLLWIATFGQGLFAMDPSTFELRKIKEEDGLSEQSFYALISDNYGNIWTSLSSYLLKLTAIQNLNDPIEKIERFDVQEGFPPQQYFTNSVCKGADGALYFGGDDGYVSFYPEEINKIVFYPQVSLTDILVNGKSLEIKSEKEGQSLNAPAQKTITLPYDQSNISIQFIAPNYINPENTWYQYQLSSAPDVWQDLKNSNSLNFSELKSGTYELKLRASSDPNLYADKFTSINLVIKPPYWGTPAAYFVYLIIILSLLYLFFTIARKWERLNQNLKFEHLQREQEKEFNQQRLKFFTDISHELRTPLTLILAPLERIVQTNFGNAKIKNQLMLMMRNGERMLQLINQLLDLRKLETGHMQLQAAKGNIVGFTREVSLSFRELAQSRSIDFQVESIEPKINLWFDRDKFEIILFNLLSNALKFTPDGGSITLSIEKVSVNHQSNGKREIAIAIENTGKGIKEDQVHHIFKRFYSGQQVNEKHNSGSGVGLEIVKNLVDLHKGTIAVQSSFNEDGKSGVTKFELRFKAGGSHFTNDELIEHYKSSEDINNYKLPIGLISVEELQQNEVSSEISDHESTILVVEDNREVRSLVLNIFSESYNILEAENGKEALSIASEHVPDLIISDIMMPEMDGIELCRTVKTNIHTSHIPIILLTARTAVTFKYEGLETGADDYIVKPFNVEDLRVRAVNLIKQRKKLKERFSQSGLMLPHEISLTSVDEKLLQNTIDYVMENIESNDLTVDIIAKNIGMSRTNFYRKIKALTGMSASEFIRKIKMDRAAQLLKTNKIRVSEVRFMVGISDADYFRDCFKKQFGITPKEYIESN